MLCTCKTNQHIVVGAEALLGLQLSSYEVTIDVLHATNACKGHLLLDVVSEVVTTDGITEDRWQDGSEEQTTIEHGLQREATTKGERHAPVSTDVAQTWFLAVGGAVDRTRFKTCKIVGQIGIFCFEACATSGKQPVVFTIVVDACTIAEVVLVDERHLLRRLRTELVAVVQIVPTQSHLEIEMAQVEIEGCEL